MASSSPRSWSTISSRGRVKDPWHCGLDRARSHTSPICASRNEFGRVSNTQYDLDLDRGLHDRVCRVCAKTTRSLGSAGMDYWLCCTCYALHLRIQFLSRVES